MRYDYPQDRANELLEEADEHIAALNVQLGALKQTEALAIKIVTAGNLTAAVIATQELYEHLKQQKRAESATDFSSKDTQLDALKRVEQLVTRWRLAANDLPIMSPADRTQVLTLRDCAEDLQAALAQPESETK